MRRILTATMLTSALSSLALVVATPPACAQMDQTYDTDQGDSGISLDYFSEQLAPYGYWLYSDRWGLVWQPADVAYDFHPYSTAGHWVYTDEYGWYWQSHLPWGDIPFHYGRWVNDPDSGWLWIPGYTWSPGWVVWRSNGRYIGWMPMPPDDAFLGGRGDMGFGGLSFRFGAGDVGGLYGYSRWYGQQYNETLFAQNWTFVGLGDIARPDYRAVAIINPGQIVNIIHQTRNVTNYTVVNNYVVNKSVDIRIVERAAGRQIPAVRAATVIRHPNLVATVAVGQRVQMRMRAIAPRGSGIANSAPPPPARVVAKLSTRVPPPRAGQPPTHLFNKTAVSAPDARARFHGTPPPASGPAEAPGGMTGPNGGSPGAQRPGEMPGPNGGPSPNAGQPGGMTNGERPRRESPGGMTGPNGGPPPNAGQSGEMSGPRGQPGAATGSMGERPRRESPNGMTGPNGPSSNAEQPGGGMTGPNSQPDGTTGPMGERPHRERPTGMTGPNGGPPSNTERPGGVAGPNAGPPGAAQPGSMTGPGGERPRAERPSGTTGPNGGPPGGTARPNAGQPHGAQPNGPQGNSPHPPKKQPPQNPPENPPQ